MALIKCSECSKEVSNSAYECTNCGFVINKPRRSIAGNIAKFLFVGFNVLMGFTVIMTLSAPGSSSISGVILGSGVFVWILGAIPLGILSYITRPKSND
jgi:DNA-directed RNA polymerase subunit RPC12/RpoP